MTELLIAKLYKIRTNRERIGDSDSSNNDDDDSMDGGKTRLLEAEDDRRRSIRNGLTAGGQIESRCSEQMMIMRIKVTVGHAQSTHHYSGSAAEAEVRDR